MDLCVCVSIISKLDSCLGLLWEQSVGMCIFMCVKEMFKADRGTVMKTVCELACLCLHVRYPQLGIYALKSDENSVWTCAFV